MPAPYIWDVVNAEILSRRLQEKFGITVKNAQLERDGGLSLTYLVFNGVSKEEVLDFIAETEEGFNETA